MMPHGIPMRGFVVLAGLLLFSGATTACVAPTTHLAPLAPGVVEAEALRQRELALVTRVAHQERLDEIAFPILLHGAPLCSAQVAPRVGIRYATMHAYDETWRPAAMEALGMTDTITILSTVPQSAGGRAGVEAGDRVLSINGIPVPTGKGAEVAFSRIVSEALADSTRPLELRIRRDAVEHTMTLVPDRLCAFGTTVVSSGMLNALADGQSIIVTTAMMRFAEDDELGIIVAHELAHNAMGHIRAKQQNATVGAFFGLLADVAVAYGGGVNYGPSYTSQFAQLGAMTFSQDFEREADYVGLYAMALAGLPLEPAPRFWRHMAQEEPGSIGIASSHPTSAERFVRLEMAMEEIERKRAANEPLRPTLKREAEAEEVTWP